MIDIDKKFREMTKKDLKRSMVFLVVMVIVGVLSLIGFLNLMEKKYWSHKKISTEDSLYLKLERFDTEKSAIFFDYKEERVYLHVQLNKEYTPRWFVSFIQKGDSIVKEA